jgi:ParB/RepB/Spo0J family partition protein
MKGISSMMKMVLLSKIKDNQYRNKVTNPLIPVRIEHLTESIKTTGFWKGVYGREQGEFTQITFGHGRVEAARKAGLKEIPVEVEELSDEEMLKRMTRENLRGELKAALEAVNAAVKAFAVGAVKFEDINPKTNASVLRYAPSFVAGKLLSDPSDGSHAYTADTLARVLGGVYVKAPLEGRTGYRATELVTAALGILEMEERNIPGFSERILRAPKKTIGDDNEEVGYIGAREIIEAVSDIRKREVFDKAKAEKRQEELDRYNAKQKELEEQRKEHEEKARLEREALIQKQLAAKVEEDTKEIARLAQKMREQAANAKLKQIADSEKLTALNAKIAEAKKKAEEAKVEDAYAPVRRDVERFLFRVSNVSTGSFCEDTKALARLPLSAGDRERLRQAVLKLGTWYCEWVAMQFIPPVSGKKELKEMKARELANRHKEEAAAKAAEETARRERVAAKAVAKKKTKESK